MLHPPCRRGRHRARPAHLWCAFAALALGCGDSSSSPPDAGRDGGSAPEDASALDGGPVEPIVVHCDATGSCPEIIIEGDPIAAASPFRGVGDPSLELDPRTGALFLTYSWLDTIVTDPGPPPTVYLAVRTHLARSDDSGRSFQFVSALNEATPAPAPADPTTMGYLMNEVSTIVRRSDDDWELMWLEYFQPPTGDRYGFSFVRATAPGPETLGGSPERWIRGVVEPYAPARHDFTSIVPGRPCLAMTEPALFTDESGTYLAANCFTGTSADDTLALFRERADEGYDFLGVLLDGADAAALSANRLEQADLSRGRDGRLVLLVTPIRDTEDPMHQGCVALEIDDLATAHVAREMDGSLRRLAVITSDGNGLGPGLCTHDAASETGVMLVRTDIDLTLTPPRLLFVLEATGVRL